MIAAQGGKLANRVRAADVVDWTADRDGVIEYVDLESIGWAVIELGGGRKQAGDAVDHSVGLECLVRTGDSVVRGQPLVRIHARPGESSRIDAHLRRAISIREEPLESGPLIIERIQ